MGGPGRDQLSGSHAADCGGGTDRQLGALPAGQIRRRQSSGILFSEISKTSPCHRRKNGVPQEKGISGRVCQQAAPHGTYDHLHSGRDGKDGFCKIYDQLSLRDLSLESGFCRSRIFLRGRGCPVFILGYAGEKQIMKITVKGKQIYEDRNADK